MVLAFVEEVADDLLMLHEGNIIASGELQEVLVKENATTLENVWLNKIKL